MTWQFTLAGLLVGILVGMTGMGGGSLMTPILILFFGFDAKVAVGTDLLHGAIFKSFGAAQHRMLGTVHARLALWMLLGSAPLSLVGVADRQLDGQHRRAPARSSAIALIVGGLGFLLKTYIHGHPSDAPFLLARRDKLFAVAIGASCGFVVGLTSVGSGTFFGLAMLFLFPLTAYKIVGTDMFHAAMLLWVAGLASLLHGSVDTARDDVAARRLDPRRADRARTWGSAFPSAGSGSPSGSCSSSRASRSPTCPRRRS